MKNSLNCGGRLVDLSTAQVMGILNLTPDSFFDGGKNLSDNKYLRHTENMIKQGAMFIDVGGQSTRPGASYLNAEEEWNRMEAPVKKLCKEFPATLFSIDTFHSLVAKRAIESGFSIINDVSGGSIDSGMFTTVASLRVPYILMHMQGTPQNMQVDPQYIDVVYEVMKYFSNKLQLLKDAGVIDPLIDPGFGFGKTTEHNFQLLNKLNLFMDLNCPIVVGLSRKSMITQVLNIKKEEALNGTSILNTIALIKGARILRVHDVKEAVEAVKLVHETDLLKTYSM